MKTGEQKRNLIALEREIKSCEDCPLWKEAERAVPGEGDANARIMLIGEAPGQEEDKQGRPFVGKSGQKLTSYMNQAGLSRDQTYITNVVKHRPPNNRDPQQEEIEACSPYLRKQVEIIDPEIIITLGNFALNFILGRKGIAKARGQSYKQRVAGKERKVIPTYHPAATLYNPQVESKIKQDFELIGETRGGQTDLSSY